MCGTSTFDETARLLEAVMRARRSRWVGLAWCAPEAAPLASVWQLAADYDGESPSLFFANR
jgi:hypothetical protein